MEAVNQLFLHAEGHGDHAGYAAGAFRFRKGEVNPLPFDAGRRARPQASSWSASTGRTRRWRCAAPTATTCAPTTTATSSRTTAPSTSSALLNDPRGRLRRTTARSRAWCRPTSPSWCATGSEAAAIRRALAQRKVASVYLSDKDSVVDSDEAADVLRWLHAVANPLDGGLARAAFATRTAGLPLAELARLSADELAWEERVEQLKALHTVWQRQGVLAMLRRFIHELGLPSALLREAGGERRLTNLLHLAELLQSASSQLDGEQALIRWFAEQVAGQGEGGDERVLRLESDAELVKVVTVHKSKGLEYPLVYLPFAVTARKTDRRNRSFFEYVGRRRRAPHRPGAVGRGAGRGRPRAHRGRPAPAVRGADARAPFPVAGRGGGRGAQEAASNRLHESALGYLLGGGDPIAAADLHGALGTAARRLRRDRPAARWTAPEGMTMLDRARRAAGTGRRRAVRRPSSSATGRSARSPR